MTSMSSNDDTDVSGNQNFFAVRFTGGETREIATPPRLQLNFPSPENIGNLRLPVSV
jgi:hypothetical protein